MPTPRSRRATAAQLAAGWVVAAVALTGCSATPTTGSATAKPVPGVPVPPARLVTASDLGPGWSAVGAAALPCQGVPSAVKTLGTGATTVRLAGPGGTPTVVEYAVRPATLPTAYAGAVGTLQRMASCTSATAGPTDAVTFVGVLPLPRFGDRSVCMVFDLSIAGQRASAGYEVVRQGPFLAVVGVTAPGTVDVATLQRATTAAVAKLAG